MILFQYPAGNPNSTQVRTKLYKDFIGQQHLNLLIIWFQIKVTVLYEALCPYSQQFITKQLFPTYKKLSKYLDVELVPYGLAEVTIS